MSKDETIGVVWRLGNGDLSSKQVQICLADTHWSNPISKSRYRLRIRSAVTKVTVCIITSIAQGVDFAQWRAWDAWLNFLGHSHSWFSAGGTRKLLPYLLNTDFKRLLEKVLLPAECVVNGCPHNVPEQNSPIHFLSFQSTSADDLNGLISCCAPPVA